MTSVTRKDRQLQMVGRRAGVEFVQGMAKELLLSEGPGPSTTITLLLDIPPDGDYARALNVIFLNGLPCVAPVLPPYWHEFAMTSFGK